jgi:hypothetical protein
MAVARIIFAGAGANVCRRFPGFDPMLYRNEASETPGPSAMTRWVEEMGIGSFQGLFVTGARSGERTGAFRTSKHENMQKFLQDSLQSRAKS